MKVLKVSGIVFFSIIIIGVVAGYFFIQSLKPTYDGNLDLRGLQNEVRVKFDNYGIPHISGENQEDVYRAFGYVHAQDRLWQMELIRRITPGRLAEVFGKDLVETDKFFKTLGLNYYAEQTVKEILKDSDKDYVKLTLAYLDGINQFVDNGPTPPEYYIVGLEKSHFSLLDVENVMGFMAFSFAVAHKTDPLISKISNDLGDEYLLALNVNSSPGTTLIHNFEDSLLVELSFKADAILNSLPVSPWIGSNSWIVAPEKSKTGKVLFANDPHIVFSQPSVWYEAHLQTPSWELYGYHLAARPFASIAHNRHFAIGLTMFENDDIDFYLERTDDIHKGNYQYNEKWIPFESREEHIVVNGADDIPLIVKSTVHGPVVTDVLEESDKSSVLSMWWTYTKFSSKILEMNYDFIQATEFGEIEKAASLLHAPGLNIMYGDAKGNIAWWAAAKLPVRPDHVNSKSVLDGSTDKDEPIGYLDFAQNPHAVNPPWGYVYSANNQPDTINNQLYPGYYLPEDRAKRIVNLLESKDKLDVDDFKSMLLDETSPVAINIAKEIAAVIEVDDELLTILSQWNGSFDPHSAAPVIYQKLLYTIFELGMQDELGETTFNNLLGLHLFKRSIAGLINNDSTIWWDNITTDEKETRKDIFTEAFFRGRKELKSQLGDDVNKWEWQDVHTLEHSHALGVVDALRGFFNVGPFPVGGSSSVLNNLMFSLNSSGKYEVYAGPSTRRIVDFSDVENSYSILPTGQSGNPFSPYYEDQAQMFADGEFRLQLMNKEAIEALDKTLLLRPKN